MQFWEVVELLTDWPTNQPPNQPNIQTHVKYMSLSIGLLPSSFFFLKADYYDRFLHQNSAYFLPHAQTARLADDIELVFPQYLLIYMNHIITRNSMSQIALLPNPCCG
jgi:hypothetical protein